MKLTKIDNEGSRYARRNGKWVKITRRGDRDYVVEMGFEGSPKCTRRDHAWSLRMARDAGAEWIEE